MNPSIWKSEALPGPNLRSDPGTGRPGRMLGIALLALCGAVVGALPAEAGRPRAPAISSTVLSGITRSQAELPLTLQATDAASLQLAVNVANAIGCGVHIDVAGTITANLVLTPRCPNPDDLGIRLRGPATLYGGIFAGCKGADCAWASVEGLRVIATDDDAFDASWDGRLAVLDSEAEVDGQWANVLTAHQNGRILALASSGRSISSMRAPPLAFIQHSRAIVAGSGDFQTGTANGDITLLVGGSNPASHPVVAMIGHRLRCSRDGQFAVAFSPGGGGNAELLWANTQALCPVRLGVGSNEKATVRTFGSGQRMPLPFAIPAWVSGTEYLEVDLRP